jgi:small-conductance mechanosensitive channel
MKRFLAHIALFALLTTPLLAQDSLKATKQVVPADTLTMREKVTNLMDSINVASDSILSTGKIAEPSRIDSLKESINISDFVWTFIVLITGIIFIRLSSRILEILAEKSTKHRITIKGFIPIIKIISWVAIITTIVVGIFKPPAATVLAFTASIGVAIGFAAQDILKNIFGGIMILFDRPFQTGDKIEVGAHYGEVIEIGLRSTRIVTPDDSVVSIPNSEIMNSSVSNANMGEANCQVVAEIYLPLDIDTNLVRDIATEAAQVSKYVFLGKPIAVLFFNEYKERESLIKMRLKAYVFDIRDEFKFKSEMTEIVLKSLIEKGILKEK